MDTEELWDMYRRRVLSLPPSGSPSAAFMDPDTSDDESPAASSSSSATSSQGGHGEAAKSDLLNKMEEVEDLLAILRDAPGTEIDDDLAREIDYKMARIEAARDAAMNKARGSKVWQYLIMPVATGFGRALFHTATAFLGSYLTFMYIFGGWRPALLWSKWWSKGR